MSGTFDEKGTGTESTGKRPAPTIEGTATEVSVDPGVEDVGPQDVRSEEPESGDAEPRSPEAMPDEGAEPDAGAEATEATSDEDGAVDEAGPIETDPDASAADNSGLGDAPPPSASDSHPSLGSRLLAFVTALFTHALAGIAGGLAVLAALIWGYLPATVQQADNAGSDSDVMRIENRLAALEAGPQISGDAAAIADLKSRLAAVESGTRGDDSIAGDAAQVKALSDQVKALAEQVPQIQNSLNSMADAAKDGGSVADAAAISQQVTEAEQRLDKQLQARIQSEVKTALASSSGEDPSVETLKSEVAALDAKLKALTQATMDADGSKLQPEISALQRRLNEIESTIPALMDAVDTENAQTRKANLTLAFTGLRDAVNAGRPYATELTAMAALSADTHDLEALAEFENKGVPTLPMLTATFASLRGEAPMAEAEDGQDILGRLVGSAQSLVKVRRIGEETAGSGPDATLARAQAALEDGKLHEAVLDVEKLDGDAAERFAPWIDDALARLDVDTALQDLQKALLVSLSGDPASPRNPKSESPALGAETE